MVVEVLALGQGELARPAGAAESHDAHRVSYRRRRLGRGGGWPQPLRCGSASGMRVYWLSSTSGDLRSERLTFPARPAKSKKVFGQSYLGPRAHSGWIKIAGKCVEL